MQRNVMLYGYYKKNNFGDDLFNFIIKKWLLTYDTIVLHEVSPSDIHNFDKVVDYILFGGGEIINEYFMFPIIDYIKTNNINPYIYGISIGFTDESINLLDIFNNVILRNPHNNIPYTNDLIFELPNYIKINDIHMNDDIFGYYLIDLIPSDVYNIIVSFTNIIKSRFTIKFVLFHPTRDLPIAMKIINDCDLTNYIIVNDTCIENKAREILSNKYNLCMRFHAHVICYIYNRHILSLPCTNKTLKFNKTYNISYSFELNEIIKSITKPTYTWQHYTFNWSLTKEWFKEPTNNSNNILYSTWAVYKEIYNCLLISKKKNIEYIADQIEYNILGKINTKNRYGIIQRLENLNVYNQQEFVKICTDLYNV